jgi:AraC family transcriptional regulator
MSHNQEHKLNSRSPYSWSGSLFLWSDRSFYIGAAADSIPHVTHDVTVSVALHGTFSLGTSKGWQTLRAAIIPPDLPHIFDGRGAHLVLLYFPSELFKSKRLLYPGDRPYFVPPKSLCRFLPRLHNYLDNGCGIGEATELCDGFISEIASNGHSCLALDSRVAHALECFRADPTHRFTSAEISREVSLSPSRFAHLFQGQIGLPLRSYLLELRMRRAMMLVARGESLTTAAHDAGFADSAHLSRTFRRMTGIAPSSLLKYSRVIPAQK